MVFEAERVQRVGLVIPDEIKDGVNSESIEKWRACDVDLCVLERYKSVAEVCGACCVGKFGFRARGGDFLRDFGGVFFIGVS